MRCSIHTLSVVLLLPVAAQAQDLVPIWGGSMGTSGSDNSTGIVLDGAGHFYTAGSFTGTMDVDPGPGVTNLVSAGGNDIYVTKFDTNGTLIWARAMGGAYNDGALAVAVDASGNVYTTGGFCGTADFDPGAGSFNMTAATTGETDIFISKLDSDGDFVWAKGIIGGTWWDHGHGIAIDPSGNVVITGRFYYQGGPRDFDPGPGTFFLTAGHEDIFVLKLDTNGDFLWAVAFGTAPDESRGYAVALNDVGDIFITGYFRGTVDFDPGPGTVNLSSVGTWNIFYLKLDATGDLVWVRSLPISTDTYYTDGGYGRKIAIDADGNLLTTGRYSGSIDFDPGAGTSELTASGGYDVYVTKFSDAGELIWAKSFGGDGYDEGFGITARSDGRILLTGTFEGTADLDPSTDTLAFVSAGAADAFILDLTSDGELEFATSLGGSDNDRGYALVSGGPGTIYLTGWFAGTTDLDPGNGTLSAVSAGSNDAFLVKLIETDGTGLSEEEVISGNGIRVQPNPASDRATMLLDASMAGKRGTIEVFNATGKRVHAERVSSLNTSQPLDLPGEWSEGLYMVVVRVEGGTARAARVMVRR